EREREIRDFTAESSFKVTGLFTVDGQNIPAELSTRLPDQTAVQNWLNKVKTASYRVSDVSQKPGSRSPAAPFTTSTLQQEAARRLGFSVRQTMTLAQRLYEAGQITYMRTDSTVLSGQAIAAAESYIKSTYGAACHQRR